jgi:hypothetical protein
VSEPVLDLRSYLDQLGPALFRLPHPMSVVQEITMLQHALSRAKRYPRLLPTLRQQVYDVGHYVTAGHCTTIRVRQRRRQYLGAALLGEGAAPGQLLSL